MLEIQQKRHDSKERYLTKFDMIKHIADMKSLDEFKWLYEVSNASLQLVCANLASAYNRLFNHVNRFPKFKSKRNAKQIYPVRADTAWFGQNKIHVEKIGKIKYKTDFDIPLNKRNIIKKANISISDGKYYFGFVLDCDNQTVELTDKPMGIDLGIKELATVAFGSEKLVFHNINKAKKMQDLEKKIVYHQKIASRKREANRCGEKSNNLIKEEAIIKKLSARRANIRKNYIHQTTHILVSLRPSKVVMETLSFEDMLGVSKTHNKNVEEANFYEFTRQMEYKCKKNNIPFVYADKYFKSSKICSSCGCVKQDLKLSDRKYICSSCGLTIDRDYNAAINLMRYEAQ